VERVEAIIKKLTEQYEAKTDSRNLLLTAQTLVNELQELTQKTVITGKSVAVILPSGKRPVDDAPEVAVTEKSELKKESNIALEVKEPVEQKQVLVASQLSPTPEKKEDYTRYAPPVTEKPTEKKSPKPFIPESNPIEEIPTFSYHQKEAGEINDIIAKNEKSLNDRLKVEKKELGSMLKEAPVRDLRKAIGINDRFVFINELFRGDENMYERSVKTINSFSILAEAEFWIQRELKVKIGWNENNEVVQHFDQLVRRRFS
jgi:hypothetical protein